MPGIDVCALMPRTIAGMFTRAFYLWALVLLQACPLVQLSGILKNVSFSYFCAWIIQAGNSLTGFCSFSPPFAPRLSWVLLYISLIFVMSILMAVIATASSLFPQSSAFVIFLLFFLYGISSVSIPGLVEFGHPISGLVFFFSPSHLILFSLLKHLEQM